MIDPRRDLRPLFPFLVIFAAACSAKNASPPEAPADVSHEVSDDDGDDDDDGGGCDLEATYELALAWAPPACVLEPASLGPVSFTITARDAGTFEVTLADGVMNESSSPYYDDVGVEEIDQGSCRVTVRLAQPPSHRIWATLTLALQLDGTEVTGIGTYSESFEGEVCESTAVVTGKTR